MAVCVCIPTCTQPPQHEPAHSVGRKEVEDVRMIILVALQRLNFIFVILCIVL